jgi:glycosyltransferase involved in cell wall biosynthesis
MPQPLVSCLMVTRDRKWLARRAIQCFAEQTWVNKELVIVDDGSEDYGPAIDELVDRPTVHYERVPEQEGRHLGGIRNLALDLAHGDYCMQWDDDEWYHPTRIERQMLALERQELDACVLKWTLMHIDSDSLVDHLYRADAGHGTPGTVVHRRTELRYPNLPRNEDSVFLRRLSREMRVGIVAEPHSHLFIRCFHGQNTWDANHFVRRLRRTPRMLCHYLWARFVRGDLLAHPAFRLDPTERAAAARFLRESRALEVIAN